MSSVTTEKRSTALSIGLLPLDRFTMTPFATFIDVLRLAADKGDRSEQRNCSWVVTSPGRNMVTSSAGVQIATDRQPPDPRVFDYIAVFGGVLNSEKSLSNEILEYLRKADDLGVPLIGVCTGSYALIDAGLMKGRTTCVSWFHHHDYLEAFGDIPLETGQLFLEDNDRITCSGGGASGDLALWLVKEKIGERWAKKCQRILLLEEMRPPTRSQPLPSLSANVTDPVVRQVVLSIERSLSENLTTGDLAGVVNIGRRQLERKFRTELHMGVQEFIREMRLKIAQDHIRNTNQTVTDIAYECGFKSHTHFSALFKSKFGIAPKELRKQLQSGGDFLDP